MRTAAVIVTHNRLSILKDAIDAIKNQSVVPQDIFVINNGCTDGTEEWLNDQQGLTCVHQANKGCSDGFSKGLRIALDRQADWIWIMDDDTIPRTTALESLHRIIENNVTGKLPGFLCSRVEWLDGTPHKMNIPHISIISKHGLPFNYFDDKGALLVNACSFVSVLVNAKTVAEIGLPYKEFFIWGDDMEYTQRIIKAGYDGLYVPASVVLHKTAVNYSADLFNDDGKSKWKYSYGIRNTLFMLRRDKGLFKYFATLLKYFFVMPFRILKKRKDHKWSFIKIVWKATWDSIFFNPAIDQI